MIPARVTAISFKEKSPFLSCQFPTQPVCSSVLPTLLFLSPELIVLNHQQAKILISEGPQISWATHLTIGALMSLGHHHLVHVSVLTCVLVDWKSRDIINIWQWKQTLILNYPDRVNMRRPEQVSLTSAWWHSHPHPLTWNYLYNCVRGNILLNMCQTLTKC